MNPVAPFYLLLDRRVVTVASILDDPAKPMRCGRCRRRCRQLVNGLGPRCLRRAGIRPPRARRPRGVEHAGPDLLDLLAASLVGLTIAWRGPGFDRPGPRPHVTDAGC